MASPVHKARPRALRRYTWSLRIRRKRHMVGRGPPYPGSARELGARPFCCKTALSATRAGEEDICRLPSTCHLQKGVLTMIRKASAVWRGNGKAGKGTLSSDSGVLSATPYSFRTRFEDEKGTNPEEL